MGVSATKGTAFFKRRGGNREVIELVKANVTESKYEKAYGHNRSKGAQDIVYGTWKLEGTLNVMVRGRNKRPFAAGSIVYVRIYPAGKRGMCYHGWAGITSDVISYTIENGEPVAAEYKISSKATAPGWAKGTREGRHSGAWRWTRGKGGGGGGGGSGGSGSSSGGSGSSGSESGSASSASTGSGGSGGSGSGSVSL